MSDGVRDLISRGVAALKAGEPEEARRYFEWALRLDPTAEQQLRAWLYLSQVCSDPADQRRYLTLVLSIEPGHQLARRSLAILDGRLKADEVVDANQPLAQPSFPSPAQARRTVCPTCGGKLVYTPDGRAQVCESCDRAQLVSGPNYSLEPDYRPDDFTVAMATAQGHTLPLHAAAMECQACGAAIPLLPGALTAACPYCRSAYTLDQEEEGHSFRLEALIPLCVSLAEALESVKLWRLSNAGRNRTVRVTGRQGWYLPFWLFSFLAPESSGRRRLRTRRYTQKVAPTIVSASRLLPEGADAVLDSFDLSGLVPFNPAYLADWKAGTYQVSLADASLAARWLAVERLRAGHSGEWFTESGRPVVTSMDLLVERFWLVLLPFWVIAFRHKGQEHAALLNGQTGVVLQVLPVEQMKALL